MNSLQHMIEDFVGGKPSYVRRLKGHHFTEKVKYKDCMNLSRLKVKELLKKYGVKCKHFFIF